jgi:hypothetical protein
MMAKEKFKTGNVDEWMDCGNKNVIETIQNAGFTERRGSISGCKC